MFKIELATPGSSITTMSISRASQFIESTKGRFFTVQFVKRTKPHDTRTMICRTGVRCHLRGGHRSYDAADHGLSCVWDIQKKAYRSIPLDGVISIKCGNWAERVSALVP